MFNAIQITYIQFIYILGRHSNKNLIEHVSILAYANFQVKQVKEDTNLTISNLTTTIIS